MFKQRVGGLQQSDYNLLAPIGGVDAVSPLMRMPEIRAILSENWYPMPHGMVMRPGYTEHATGLTNPVERLHNYAAATGGESLWASCADGVYNVTSAGAVGAVAIALTDGKTISSTISTGAGANYLMLVNGVDTLKQYDGTAWTSVATLGAVNTQTFSYVETYRQRLFFVTRNSLDIAYLAPNSISGAPTAYPMGAIFRQGGYIVALGTWTVDGGVGPEDSLAVYTSKGEVAVFAGNDPATWSFRGVYFLGKPLGVSPLLKYGGDLLALTENGLYPLSAAVQSTSIDRIQVISQDIQPLLSQVAASYSGNYGWQIFSDPALPALYINIPSTPLRRQAVMNGKTGKWTFYSGWDARCLARLGNQVFFGGASKVYKVGGVSDAGANITATLIQAPNRLRHGKNKQISLARPYFSGDGGFFYNMGVVNNFINPSETTQIVAKGNISAAIWGVSLFGQAMWTGGTEITEEWQTIPDEMALWKSLYLQVVSKNTQVTYYGTDVQFLMGGAF